MLDLLPLYEAVQVDDNLLLNFHFILQLVNDPLLNLGLLRNFVKLNKYEFELFDQVLLDLLEALLDVNVHLRPQLKLNVLQISLVAFLKLLDSLLEVPDSHLVLNLSVGVHHATRIHLFLVLKASLKFYRYLQFRICINFCADLILLLPQLLHLCLL